MSRLTHRATDADSPNRSTRSPETVIRHAHNGAGQLLAEKRGTDQAQDCVESTRSSDLGKELDEPRLDALDRPSASEIGEDPLHASLVACH